MGCLGLGSTISYFIAVNLFFKLSWSQMRFFDMVKLDCSSKLFNTRAVASDSK